MKFIHLLLSLSFCFIITHTFSQGPAHCALDSAYVWAKNGLSLRAAPSQDAEILAILPYSTQVKHLSKTYSYSVRPGVVDSILIVPRTINRYGKENRAIYLSDKWYEVEHQGKRGYMFGAYLSKLRPLIAWQSLESVLTADADTIYRHRLDSIRYNYQTVYDNGVVSYSLSQEGGGTTKYVLPGNFTFSDGYALMNYLLEFNFVNKLDGYGSVTAGSKSNSNNMTYQLNFFVETKEGTSWSCSISYDRHSLSISYAQHC